MGKISQKILTIFGTRPEIIKLCASHSATRGLRQIPDGECCIVSTYGPPLPLCPPVWNSDRPGFANHGTQPDAESSVFAGVGIVFDPTLAQERPEMILVQGDTTTAMSGALAGFHRRIPVAHVEAGLRTGDAYNPYPEEMNRRIITRLATYHFAATPHNRDTLLSEGVPQRSIFVTGNPGLDSLKTILERSEATPALEEVFKATKGLRRIILTTHRRESFGQVMAENLRVLKRFIDQYEDIGLIFPVHPNPAVLGPATSILAGHPRIHLIKPLSYEHFIVLLSHAWLIVSDSGGVQEEAPTLGKPLLILRKNTHSTAGDNRVRCSTPRREALPSVWALCLRKFAKRATGLMKSEKFVIRSGRVIVENVSRNS